MPRILQYIIGFRDQTVRFVLESIEPTESRKEAQGSVLRCPGCATG